MLKSKKVFLYILASFVTFAAIWVVYSINQPPKWAGDSGDRQWRTSFTNEINSKKGYWNGHIYWKGKEKVTLQKAILQKNGSAFHEWTGNEALEREKPFEYLYTTKTLDNQKDHYVLKISWEDANGKHETAIDMSPKKRYFVLPKSLQ